jgi:hypothetical protein
MPAPRHRPKRVTTSVILLLLAATAMLAASALALGTGALTAERGDVRMMVISGAPVNVVFAAGFIALARCNALGRHLGPAGTWVLGALGVGYVAIILAGQALGASVRLAPSEDNVLDSANLDQALRDVRPAWHIVPATALSLIWLVTLLAAMALLMSSTAARYFRPGFDEDQAQGPPDGSDTQPAPDGVPPTMRMGPAADPPPHTRSLTAVDPWTQTVQSGADQT